MNGDALDYIHNFVSLIVVDEEMSDILCYSSSGYPLQFEDQTALDRDS